jgi:hypothetical protein
MAPLSRELTGVILPHDHFGTLLDTSGRTVDDDLELMNFAEAGKVLASIWSGVTIDGFPVVTRYICPPDVNTITDSSSIDVTVSQKWRATHVRESQYCLQVVRCNDLDCCSTWRSAIKNLLPNRFLPNPVPAQHSGMNIVASIADSTAFLPLFVYLQLNSNIQIDAMANFSEPPYDLHCPSVEPRLTRRCCSVCGLYHAAVKGVASHKKGCHLKAVTAIATPAAQEKTRPVRIAARRQREMMVILRDHLSVETAEWLDTEDIDATTQEPDQPTIHANSVTVIDNMQQWMDNPWQDV